VFDFKFKSDRGAVGAANMDKIVFIQLCPDSASVKRKMVYASSASAIKQTLGSSKLLQMQVSRVGNYCFKSLKCDPKGINILFPAMYQFIFTQVSDEAEISHRELFAKLSEKFNRND
jgi:hypothetical protein